MGNGTRTAGAGCRIAVIGLGCVMPDAPDVARFWKNLREGRSSIREVPPTRWDPRVFYSPDRRDPDKTYSKLGSFVEEYPKDWTRFRIPPNVVRAIDPSQLWALEATDQALRDAGYDRRPFGRSRCAVILGNSGGGEQRVDNSLRIYWNHVRERLLRLPQIASIPEADRDQLLRDFEREFKRGLPEVTEDSLPGELSNVIAGRVANAFDLGGKNYTIDAACAASAAALDAAVHALSSGEADTVIAGGVDRFQEASLYVKFSRVGALSANGSRPFDARADGFVMGEGAGVLVLKRLEDAERDGDRVYAVIRGIGSSSDGRGRALTAPRLEGQVQCLSSALAHAGVDPSEIDLVECHGTGTVVGDATELRALLQAYGPRLRPGQRIPIGSVKSNIGHLKSAAAAAGILKTVLAIHHGVLPPSIGFEQPNPVLQQPGFPFFVNTRTSPWPVLASGRPRRAAVSSFGFGGINFHLILEGPPGPMPAGHVEAAQPQAVTAAPAVPEGEALLAERVATSIRAWLASEGQAAPSGTDPLPIDVFQRTALISRLRHEYGIERSRPAPVQPFDLPSLVAFVIDAPSILPGPSLAPLPLDS